MCLHKLGRNNREKFSRAYKNKIIPAVLIEWDPVSCASFVSRLTRNLHCCYIYSTKLPNALCVHTLHHLIMLSAINRSDQICAIYSTDFHTCDKVCRFHLGLLMSCRNHVKLVELFCICVCVCERLRELIEYSLLKKPVVFLLFQ